MKKMIQSLFSATVLAVIPHVATADIIPPPGAQPVQLSFSGGDGTPLSLTFDSDFSFTVHTEAAGWYLVIDGLFDAPSTGLNPLLSGPSFTTNAISKNFDMIYTALTGAYYTTTYDLAFGRISIGALIEGDVIDFFAGTFITADNFSEAPPIDGVYNAYVVHYFDGSIIASPTVPEPSTYAALAGLAVLGCALIQRRRKAA